MEWLQSEIALWSQNVSAWLQANTGLPTKDLALFLGGIMTVLAMLWLGLYSGKPRHREAARFGWCILIVALLLICWGLYNHNPGYED